MSKEAIQLRCPTTLKDGGFTIDADKGEIRGISIIAEGPALGHGFNVDKTMLKQVVEKINASGGVRSRFGHPGFLNDAIGTMIGRVSNARLDGDKVRGDLKLSSHASKTPHGDLRDYVLSLAEEDPDAAGMSIVFMPDDFEEFDDGRVFGRVANVLASDLVDTPAANPAGMLHANTNRNDATAASTNPGSAGKDHDMSTDSKKSDAAGTSGKDDTNTQALSQQPTQAGKTGANDTTVTVDAEKVKADALAAQKLVNAEIKALAVAHELGAEWALEQIEKGHTLAQAKEAALESYKTKHQKPDISVTGGADRNLESLAPAITDAILMSAGVNQYETERRDGTIAAKRDSSGRAVIAQPHARANEYAGLGVLEMFRMYLMSLGVKDAVRLSRTALADLLSPREFRRQHRQAYELAQSSSDFDSILQDAINKSLRAAYLDQELQWSIFFRRATASDFKTINRAALSESPNLTQITEGQGIQYVTLSDGKESYQLAEYNGGIKLTRRAIINDDLDAFSRIPMMQASAAARKEDDLAFAVLTANAAMADGGNLFNSTAVTTTGGHANLVSGTGNVGAPTTVAVVDATRKLMRKQKGPKNAARLNIRPAFVIVPTALETGAEQFFASTVDPSKNNSTPNPFNGTMRVIANPRLDDTDAAEWYMLADYRTGLDTGEVAFLQGEPLPVLKQETDFDTEDMKFAVRHTCAAAAIEWRTMVKNPGD